MKIVFLHGNLDEEIFMTQSEGFKASEKEKSGLQAKKVSIWAKAIAEAMAQAV